MINLQKYRCTYEYLLEECLLIPIGVPINIPFVGLILHRPSSIGHLIPW